MFQTNSSGHQTIANQYPISNAENPSIPLPTLLPLLLQSPSLNPPHLQIHPLNGLRRNRPRNMNLLLGILHLKRKPAHHTRHGTPQLRPRKVLPNTRPLPMQERNLRKVRRRTPIIIRNLVPRFVRINPSLGEKILTMLAPEDRGAVDRVGAQDQAGSPGDVFACDRRVADGFADCNGHGWVKA